MHNYTYLAIWNGLSCPVNRVSELVRTNKLDPKLRNENYCKTNFGTHATQVIMDAIDSSKR